MTDPREPETTVRITSEFKEIESWAYSSGGSNDYSRERRDIVRIADRTGVEHDPEWEEEPTELFAGVEGRERDDTGRRPGSRKECHEREEDHRG